MYVQLYIRFIDSILLSVRHFPVCLRSFVIFWSLRVNCQYCRMVCSRIYGFVRRCLNIGCAQPGRNLISSFEKCGISRIVSTMSNENAESFENAEKPTFETQRFFVQAKSSSSKSHGSSGTHVPWSNTSDAEETNTRVE